MLESRRNRAGFFGYESSYREREEGVVYCGWSGTLWLKGGRMFAKRVDLDTIILYR